MVLLYHKGENQIMIHRMGTNDFDGWRAYPNYILHNTELTLEEYAVLIRLLSNKDDWVVNDRTIRNMFVGASQNKIRTAMAGLKAKHYLKRVPIIKDEKTKRFGGSTYDVYEYPYE